MNLDVPYERLGTKSTIDYIPLKLALDDINDHRAGAPAPNPRPTDHVNFADNATIQFDGGADAGSCGGANTLLVALVSVVCVLVVLYAVYAIYVFIILRERQTTIASQQKFF